VLEAPDRTAMLDWLRQQHMALQLTHQDQTYLLVHAGVLPAWTTTQTVALAKEVEAVVRGPNLDDFLRQMYANEPAAWSDSLRGAARLRVIVNALTRLRYCTPDGVMEFDAKDGLDKAPAGFMPWFNVPGRKTSEVVVAFGHWSTLGWLDRSDVLALDSGCVWGGRLSALKLADGMQPQELIQVPCAQAQQPGQ
jgi:bis(5'-nucleosyl)-tetraphosphatase (symmetrical)